jgi:hypothetical protein
MHLPVHCHRNVDRKSWPAAACACGLLEEYGALGLQQHVVGQFLACTRLHSTLL